MVIIAPPGPFRALSYSISIWKGKKKIEKARGRGEEMKRKSESFKDTVSS